MAQLIRTYIEGDVESTSDTYGAGTQKTTSYYTLLGMSDEDMALLKNKQNQSEQYKDNLNQLIAQLAKNKKDAEKFKAYLKRNAFMSPMGFGFFVGMLAVICMILCVLFLPAVSIAIPIIVAIIIGVLADGWDLAKADTVKILALENEESVTSILTLVEALNAEIAPAPVLPGAALVDPVSHPGNTMFPAAPASVPPIMTATSEHVPAF